MAKHLCQWFLFAFTLLTPAARADQVAVIGYPGMPRLDLLTIQKLFTGRIIEIDGVLVTVVNAAPGEEVRSRFLTLFLNQDEDQYLAYWIVRRFIGKGSPPQELASDSATIDFIQSHPGAIGYIDVIELQPGLNVLNKK